MESLIKGLTGVFKDVVKNGAIMFAVGAVLALVAPGIADVLHISGIAGSHTADPLWMGAFFGAFGALHAVATPLFTAAFGEKKPETAAASKEKEPLVQVHISGPEVAQSFQREQDASKFRDAIATQRSDAKAADKIIVI